MSKLLCEWLIGAFCVLLPAAAHAQADPGEVKLRNECRLAEQVLRTGTPAPRREWALHRLPGCADEGAPSLARQWTTVPDSEERIEELMRVSMRLRDGRLYSQILETARNPAQPARVRVAAMLVLAKYVNPGNGVPLAQLQPPDTIRYIGMAHGSTNHRSSFDGSVPLPTGFGRQVLSLLEQLAADRDGQPREIWYAAEMLRLRVAFDLHLDRT